MQINDFLKRRADDVMITNVTTLGPNDSLANAAYKFLHYQISGAPVVDQVGKCIGVLSVTDVVGAAEKVAARQAEVADAFFGRSDLILPASVYEKDLADVRDKIAPAAEQPVSSFMVSDIVAVKADDTLEKIVRNFVDAHVHRVLVVDDDDRLLGLVSTIDVMASLLRIPV